MQEKKKKKTNNGKQFEQDFMESAEDQGYFVERFKDSNKFGQNTMTRFTSHNPADCFIFDNENNQLIYCELKSTEGKSFSIEADWLSPNRMIHYHQINSLLERTKYDNVYGVFVLFFITSGNCYWISAEDLLLSVIKSGKVSINELDLQKCGHKIKNEPLRKTKKFKYDIFNFSNSMSWNKRPVNVSPNTLSYMELCNENQKLFKQAEREKKKELKRMQVIADNANQVEESY